MRRLIIAAALAAVTAPTLAFAQTATPWIDRRENRQENRIGAGTEDGSLTSREAMRLNRGQTRIDNMQNRAASDGLVTRRERTRMHHRQNIQNRRIFRQRHDGQG